MFISSDYLSINYGVDNTIAKFFVDREPPKDNLYWHNKLMYLRPGVGYIFIPLIVDLLNRCGLKRDRLLSADFINTMEMIGHISALEETKQISVNEAILRCEAVVKDVSINQEWLGEVVAYFAEHEQGLFKSKASAYPALHRGDMFLFSLAIIEFPKSLFQKVIEIWFALITTLLLLDDAEDLKVDKKSGEENAFIESGLNAAGFEKILKLVDENLATLASINRPLSMTFRKQCDEKISNIVF